MVGASWIRVGAMGAMGAMGARGASGAGCTFRTDCTFRTSRTFRTFRTFSIAHCHHTNRKTRAHGGRRERNQHDRRDEADGAEQRPTASIGIRPGEERAHGAEREGHRERAECNRRFERRIGSQRSLTRDVARHPAADPCARREAAHERREHRARGGDGMAHLQCEEARPRDFVDERCCAGDGVKDEEETARRHQLAAGSQ